MCLDQETNEIEAFFLGTVKLDGKWGPHGNPSFPTNTLETYLEEFKQQLQQPSIYYFISHRVDDDLLKYSNVKFLTPLCNDKQKFFDCDILPKITKKKNKYYYL